MYVCGGPYSHWCYLCVCACPELQSGDAGAWSANACVRWSVLALVLSMRACVRVCVRVCVCIGSRRMERQCMCAVVRTRIGVIHVCVRVSGAAEWRRRRMERQCMCAVFRTRIGVIHAGVCACVRACVHVCREQVHGAPMHVCGGPYSHWCYPCVCACVRSCRVETQAQ